MHKLGSFPSLEERLEQTRGRPSGFDYMRLCLALGVMAAHSVFLTGQTEIYKTNAWTVLGVAVSMIVPMFFALSGFLVAGSLERSKTLLKFLGLRVLRIMPALSVEVFLSAIVLGSIFTTLDLSDYYRDSLFVRYFFNLIGHIQYVLPGVFEQNPNHLVNGQLWTVPYELVCYILLAIVALIGAYKNSRALTLVIVACYLFQIGNTIIRPNHEFRGAGGTTIVTMFVCGLFMYRFRARIPWSGLIALGCLIATLALNNFVLNGMRFAGLPLAYLTVYVGLLNPPRNNALLSGDYSYGLYLYGYPIQQAIVDAAPNFRQWYWNLLLAVPAAFAVALCSWWLVERPCLRARHLLDRYEAWRFSFGELTKSPPKSKTSLSS